MKDDGSEKSLSTIRIIVILEADHITYESIAACTATKRSEATACGCNKDQLVYQPTTVRLDLIERLTFLQFQFLPKTKWPL